MVSIIEDALNRLGVEVVHLYDTDTTVPADLLLVHYDRSVVPEEVVKFSRKYRRQINSGALDIRKHLYADGLLNRKSIYNGPVIVKSTLNYGGQPESNSSSLAMRIRKRAERMLGLSSTALIRSKDEYRIYDSVRDVPKRHFSDHHVVQKLMPERDGDKNVLREYVFFGNIHYENIERSANLIITEDEHVSCKHFNPHPRLLEMRQKLNLDYGKLDYTMIDGEPFIFDANKTLGLGDVIDKEVAGNEEYTSMLHAFALEIVRIVNDPEFRTYDLSSLQGVVREETEPQPQLQPSDLPIAIAQNG
jgi:hypothetical protein